MYGASLRHGIITDTEGSSAVCVIVRSPIPQLLASRQRGRMSFCQSIDNQIKSHQTHALTGPVEVRYQGWRNADRKQCIKAVWIAQRQFLRLPPKAVQCTDHDPEVQT